MAASRVSVEGEGRPGATFWIEGMCHGFSLHGARQLVIELEKRIAQHEQAFALATFCKGDEPSFRYRMHTPIARS
jgi:hypothetical protein